MFAGAKGGGSSSFKQTPDNLRSNDTFEGVLGLCVGPIKGPVRGLKSLKIDGTAIENETGQLNFQDFTATMADGDPLKFPQTVQLKLGAGAAPTQVGLSLPNEGGGNPIWITKTLNNTGADFIDLRFVVQQLFRQDAKGIYAATATLEIQMKPVGSATWINPTIGTPSAKYNEQGGSQADLYRQFIPRDYYDQNENYNPGSPNFVINGKTTSAAVYELRLGVPNEGRYANTAWDIRVRLLERESYIGGKDNADQEKRTVAWESMAAVYGDTTGTHEDWRGLAWLQLYGKASDQLTGVPEATGIYDTKIVSVPAANVYDAATRQYSPGVWDGSWNKAYTNDPAWVINDAITDELSGISLIAPGSYLNKWDALDLSKHCSELVPDGNGGTQPRYSMNIAVSTPQKAEEFIRYLAGAVGALAWDQGDGEWRVKVDKADAPSDIFTLDNIENEFIYSHTDVDTRFNDIIGQFKNEEMDYRQDSVQLFDNSSIALLGRKPTTIALVGCTNRQEAMRRVKLRLRSTVNENRVVTFTTNRRGRNIEQLSTILIADGDLGEMDKRTTGRTVAIAPDRKSIVLRDPVYIAPGVEYAIRYAVPNPDYAPDRASQPTSAAWTKPTVIETRVVSAPTATGATATLYLDAPLPEGVADNLTVALEAPNLPTMPRLFRVTSVMPQDDGERVAISAINIDVGKWAASDNVSKQDSVFTDLRGAVATPTLVPGSALLSLYRVPLEQGSQVNLQASWVRPVGAFLNGFRIQYSVNGGALQTAVERQQTATWELPNAGPGVYHVEVCAMDRRGGYSLPLVGELEVTQSLIDATQVKYVGGETLEQRKPATVGATAGAPIGTTVGGTIVNGVVVGGIPAAEMLKIPVIQAGVASLEAIDRQRSEDVAKIEEALLRGVLEAAQTRATFRDAGITVDPGTGAVRIYALDQTVERTNAVEILVASQQAQLTLKASSNYVNEQIAKASLGGDAALNPLLTRLSSAEAKIDGNSAAIGLKADLITVTNLQGSVTTLTADLRAAEGQIALKANKTVVDAINTRLGSAEVTITALGGTSGIVQEVRQARFRSNDAATAALSALLASDNKDRQILDQVAVARQEIYTKIVEDISVESGQRLLLTARMGAAEAGLQAEAIARAQADSAVTIRVDNAVSRLGAAEASILSNENTRATAQQATTSQINQAVSRIGAAEGAITLNQQTQAGINNSFSQSFTSVTSRLDGSESSVSFLLRAVNGQEAIAKLAVNADGVLTGFVVNGQTRAFTIQADRFIVGNEQIFQVDTQTGIVRMGNVEVQKIKVGSVDTPQLAAGAVMRLAFGVTTGPITIPYG